MEDGDGAAGGEAHLCGQSARAAAAGAEDDELRLEAVIRLGKAQCDASDLSAAHTLHEAFALEDALTARVPDEAKDAWRGRPTRLELSELDSRTARLG